MPRSSRPASRPEFAGHVVTAVVVSHDGAAWLPECLAALDAQTCAPDRVVAVDTASGDDSATILRRTLGKAAVVKCPADTSLGVAVQAGLDAAAAAARPGTPPSTEWVWVLHDDCAPDPDALQELLTAAVEAPSVTLLGPKVLSWDRHRLREVGVTIDSSGRRQTGLEPREVDQGQHDDAGDVLAVGTAGMLVRRELWDRLGGLDPVLPLYVDDVDFGWRANAAGERVRVAPRAVVRHAAALTVGLRRPTVVGARPGAAARRAGLLAVLANTSRWLLPFLWLRFAVEALLRALGLLLTRRPSAALDEVMGSAAALGRPLTVRAMRRRRTRTVSHGDLRGLLAPPTWRWRRLGDTLAATVGGRRAAEERARRRAPLETGPVSDDAESMDLDDTGVLVRALRRPGVLLAIGLTVLGLAACRDLLDGALHGGRLLPAPSGAGDLWSLYTASWHPTGLGSTTATPPYVAVLAVLSTLLLGKAWLVVDVLVLGAVPLAGLSAYTAAGPTARSTLLRAWGAVTYAFLPVLTGALAGGRIDVIVATILLPWVVRAVVAGVAAGRDRWHRWVGAGLALAVVVAFAPVVWPVAAVALVVVAAASRRLDRALAAVVALVVPLALLLPWTWSAVAHPRLIVAGAGLPEVLTERRPLGSESLLTLHPGGPAQPPWWVLVPLVAVALVGVTRRRGGATARIGILLFSVGVGAALVVTRLTGADAGVPAVRYWAGAPLAVASVGALAAALVAADRARPALRQHSFGWRQPVAALAGAAMVCATGWLVVAELSRGADRPLSGGDSHFLPVFAAAEIARPTSPRVIALRSGTAAVRFALLRDAAGPLLGDADVTPAADHGRAAVRLRDAVQQVAAGQASAVPTLLGFGVTMLVVPSGEADRLSRLAAVDGLDRVPSTGAVVWRTGASAGELVVLPPAGATTALAGHDVAGSTAVPLPATAGHAHTRVPAGQAGRLLVLAEPASGAWRATLDGHRLTPVRAYGWAQAWRLPASGGVLDVGRSGTGRPWWLIGELLLVLVTVVAALPRHRPEDEEAPEPRSEPGVAS